MNDVHITDEWCNYHYEWIQELINIIIYRWIDEWPVSTDFAQSSASSGSAPIIIISGLIA